MANIKIEKCTCKHEFQDKTYGASMRVKNRTKQAKDVSESEWRCTSCGEPKRKK